jgi:tetratricopeptide (TPR) repeat protein
VPKKDEPNEGSHYFEASIPAADKTPSKAPNEAPSLPKDEAPSPARQALDPASGGASSSKKAGIQGIRNAGAALHGPPSHRTLERMPTATLSSVSEAEEESQVKQDLTRPPMTQKEEVLPKPIVVEQERKKEHSSTLDALRHFNSGVTFYNQKEFAKAIQAYRKAIELDPTNFEAYNNLGILYQMLGDTKSALTAYQKSTDTNPMYEKGYNNLGLLFLLEGHYEEALEVFQKVLGINANNIESHINLGVLFKKQGQWEKAIECYQKALAINPLHRETHYNMALLYEQLEKWELAISHYQQFVQLSSKSYPELVLRVQRRLNALAAAKGNKNP